MSLDDNTYNLTTIAGSENIYKVQERDDGDEDHVAVATNMQVSEEHSDSTVSPMMPIGTQRA